MINIKMMGSFSLEMNGKTISEEDNRSKKMWLLLSYLILNRDKKVSADDIVDFLWEDAGKVTNTVSAVKTTVHRLRSMISELEPGLGARLITYRDRGYGWNDEIASSADIDEFTKLCSSAEFNDHLRAIDMYDELLPSFSDARWLKPLCSSYHERYISLVEDCCDILSEREEYDRIIEICRKAISIDSLNEHIYGYLIRSLIAIGENDEVIRVYETMSNLFIRDYGRVPSDEIRSIYRQVLKTSNRKFMPVDEIRETLREQDPAEGAFILEYDFFKTVYQTVARSITRMEHGAHISVLSVRDPEGRDLQDRSITVAVSNLQTQIMSSIRKGDIVTKCSSTQFIVLLQNCDYDNACMVSDRITSAFYRKHPHSPVEIIYSVQPVEPM